MKRRTFLQVLSAAFAGLLTWGRPQIKGVAALPRQILEVPKKVRNFVETRYAKRVSTPVEEYEKVLLPDPTRPVMVEYAYVVGKVLNSPQHKGVNIADDAAFEEATEYGLTDFDAYPISPAEAEASYRALAEDLQLRGKPSLEYKTDWTKKVKS